jgi:hypothetical protein
MIETLGEGFTNGEGQVRVFSAAIHVPGCQRESVWRNTRADEARLVIWIEDWCGWLRGMIACARPLSQRTMRGNVLAVLSTTE